MACLFISIIKNESNDVGFHSLYSLSDTRTDGIQKQYFLAECNYSCCLDSGVVAIRVSATRSATAQLAVFRLTATLGNDDVSGGNVHAVVSLSCIGKRAEPTDTRHFLLGIDSNLKEALQAGETGNWAMDLRLAAIGKTSTFKEVYGGLYIIVWQVAYLIELFYYSKKNRYRVIILGLMLLSFGIGTMSKIVLLELLVKTVSILFFKNKVKVKHLVVALVVLLVAFVAMQSIRYNNSVKSFNRNGFLITYIVGNTSAFDTLEPNSSTHCGENVFRVYYAVNKKFGRSGIKPVDPILPFIHKPLETNTYTAMYPFFKDFGYWGVGVFALLYGFLGGYSAVLSKVRRCLS